MRAVILASGPLGPERTACILLDGDRMRIEVRRGDELDQAVDVAMNAALGLLEAVVGANNGLAVGKETTHRLISGDGGHDLLIRGRTDSWGERQLDSITVCSSRAGSPDRFQIGVERGAGIVVTGGEIKPLIALLAVAEPAFPMSRPAAHDG